MRHVVSLDDTSGNDNLPIRGDAGIVPLNDLRQQMHGAIAELERLLNHRRIDVPIGDPLEGVVLLIKAHHLDLPQLAGVLECLENGRPVVAPEPYETLDLRVLDEGVIYVGLGAHAIDIVRANIDDLNRRAPDGLREPLDPLLGILCVLLAHEEHDLAAIQEQFLEQTARFPSGIHVVRAYVAAPLARGDVTVGDHYRNLTGQPVDQGTLVGGVQRRNGQAVDAPGLQVFENATLFQEIQERVGELTTVNRISQLVSRTQTLDELFEVMTLVQTRKTKSVPIVLYGSHYWKRVLNLEVLAEEGMISPEDLQLISYVDTPEDAWRCIREFYQLNCDDEGVRSVLHDAGCGALDEDGKQPG